MDTHIPTKKDFVTDIPVRPTQYRSPIVQRENTILDHVTKGRRTNKPG